MQILVLNAGSSSIKFKLFEMQNETVLAEGQVEKIGSASASLHLRWKAAESKQRFDLDFACDDHHIALQQIMQQLEEQAILRSPQQLTAIGHRVVHGGETFHKPVVIDDAALTAIKDNVPLAPLHNPANLQGIEVARKLAPEVPQIAVFDTAFHQTLPEVAYRYALPESLYREHRVRRYGFHGTSHHYVAKQAASLLGRPIDELNLITLHLGNGCSATAIQHGRSVDTSMGMTPLEGLVMGTRSGDLDPALHFYLQRESGFSNADIEKIFNKESGLKGLCDVSDMRQIQELAEAGNTAAQLAEAIFVYRIRKYIGAYLAVVGPLDALIFTGGIGENSVRIRQLICADLEHLGITLNESANQSGLPRIHCADAPVEVLMIPTNEELEIARCARELVSE